LKGVGPRCDSAVRSTRLVRLCQDQPNPTPCGAPPQLAKSSDDAQPMLYTAPNQFKMQATRVSLFRYVSAAIHPPLLDKQHVTQLLLSLNKSFHDQIARKAVRSTSALENHFESILSNPLLVTPASRLGPTHQAQIALSQLQLSFAQGRFNQAALRQCLLHFTNAPSTQKSAATIYHLLNSSDSSLLKTLDREVQIQLIRLLVRDGEHAILHSWIRSSTSRLVLPHYIQACISENNIAFAVQQALTLVPYTNEQSIGGLMVIASHLLGHVPDAAEIPQSVYLNLQQESERLATSFKTLRSRFTYATLALLNPDSKLANTHPALTFFKSSLPKEQKSAQARVNQLQLALKLAESLMNKSEYADATWVLNLAKQSFPEELGLPNESSAPVHKKEKKEASQQQKAAVLSRLDGLLST
jgi:hypothetical protein